MSLSDRLQRARTQQLVESGVLPPDHDVDLQVDAEPELEPLVDEAPAPPAPDAAGGLFAPVIIEAQPVGLHVVAEARIDLTDRPEHELDALCPTCNAQGVADMVDLVGHTVHYTCSACSTMWQVRKDAVNESALTDDRTVAGS